MNFKQKLVYMLIGSLFTLAGYFFATVINTQPPNAHAQEKTNVFDKIICKELEVVNDTGKKLLRMGEAGGGSGFILVYNKEEMAVVGMDGTDNGAGTIVIGNKEGKITVAMRAKTFLGGGGEIEVKNFDGNRGATISVDGGGGVIQVYDCIKKARRVGIWGKADVGDAGMVAVYGNNQRNPVVVMRKSMVSGGGIITVANEGNKVAATMGADVDGRGYTVVSNKEGKSLVFIGAEDDRPNDGLINVYNHKGEWRSISKD